MAAYLNASLGKIHEWYLFVDFFVVRGSEWSTINLYGDNLQIKENFRYSPFVIGLKFSFLLSIFLVKVNFYLDEGFGFT